LPYNYGALFLAQWTQALVRFWASKNVFDTTKICNNQKLQDLTYVLIHHDDCHHSDHGGRPLPQYMANKAVDANETDEANKADKANEASESN
jgi:hypothetical protein